MLDYTFIYSPLYWSYFDADTNVFLNGFYLIDWAVFVHPAPDPPITTFGYEWLSSNVFYCFW